ncbi:hypothetical protein C7C46_31275 [Streptomyces tateyamensis]|uniref:DUF7847 domain-containing protein n=1 Tax=Streptomyces tateyamensis TaxID=565073 RepID=A0A2V4NHB6_9ACTN|nr:hypothetical protein [Streptomyces tateyamensis]PYC66469.1 hypothetical protein C7C46_31275 [Streptomyces tateyamensis]
MTDTPGWVSPSSSGPEPEDVRPPADTPAGTDRPSDSPAAPPASPVAPPAAPPYQGAYGTPGGYGGAPVPPQRPGGWNPPPGWGQPQQPGWGQQPQWGQSQPQWGGQQPQWGQPQWGVRPTSPKPGVIPLRPLGVGEILDGSISTARKHWRTVLPLSLVVAVISQTAATALNWAQLNGSNNIAALVGGLAGLLVSLVAGLIVTALLTIVVSRAIIGEPVSVGTAWQAARGQLWRLVGLSLMVTLITGGLMAVVLVPTVLLGTALTDTGSDSGNGALAALLIVFGALAAIVLGIWMYIRLSLAAPALMLERQGVFEAMRRSRRLVRGSWWRLFGINVVAVLLTSLLSGAIALPFRLLSGSGGTAGGPFAGLVPDPNNPPSLVSLVIVAIGGVLAATLTTPFKSGIAVLLYVDQRIRREALDLELARAAGLPEYGGTGWADQQPPQYPPTQYPPYSGPHGVA